MVIFFTCAAALSALLLIFLLLVSPSFRKHPDIMLLKDAYIAHRGLHTPSEGIYENTLPAFQKAADLSYPIEIDIHLTADGKVIVFHDDTAKRMCGVDANIEEMTLDEIRSLTIMNTNQTIPTLEETLKIVDGSVFLLIEFKAKNNSKALCEAADAILRNYKGKYFVQSFYPQVLFWYKKHRKDVCRGQLAKRFQKTGIAKFLLGNMLLNFIGRPDFIAYRYQDAGNPMRRLVRWLDSANLGWTIRSEEELKESKKAFDGYIFENFLPKSK